MILALRTSEAAAGVNRKEKSMLVNMQFITCMLSFWVTCWVTYSL